jgi:hypothetical protein
MSANDPSRLTTTGSPAAPQPGKDRHQYSHGDTGKSSYAMTASLLKGMT